MTPTLVASRTALPPEGALAPGGGPAALVPVERPFGVGIIGVGNMGAAMAERLATLGWKPWVYDIIPAKAKSLEPFGAVALVDTKRIAIEKVAIVICVVDATQTREVLFGAQAIAPQLQPGQVVLLCPTISPQDVEDIAQRLRAQGVAVLDCPMSGGPVRAREGSMSLMVAGADAAVESCSALLNALSSGQNWIGMDRMRRAVAGDLAPRAHMTLLAKDTGLAQDCARSVGFDSPLGALASQVFAAAVQAGLADLDDAALLQFLEHPTT